MNDNQLLRYSRHILLPEIGIEGQEKLLAAHALIIGAGGLGSPIAMYLAAAGVGKFTICDHDTVDLTNLQRQIMHRTGSVGTSKVESAKANLKALNPEIEIVALAEKVDEKRLAQLIPLVDVILDASDNFVTRHAVNRVCVTAKKPLVSGAAIRFDGQVTVFDMRLPDSPCYQCLFPEEANSEETRCAVMGVFSPLVGIIGTVQAAEALKIMMGIGESLNGRVLLLDGLTMSWRSIRLHKDRLCSVCSHS